MRTLRIGRVGMTEICLHPAFPLMLLASFLFGVGGVMRTMLIVLCLHEAAHAAMAAALGLSIERLELMPFGGVAFIRGMIDVPPWQNGLVALAGPLSNLLMSMAAAFGVQMHWWNGAAVQSFVRCNLMIMLFNLLPVLPLDGGRMLRAIAGRWLGMSRTTRLLATMGMVVGGILVALGFASLMIGQANLTLILTGMYLLYAASGARSELVAQMVHRLSDRPRQMADAGTLPVRWLAVRADTPIASIPAKFSARHYHMLLIVEENGLQPRGIVSEDALLRAIVEDQRQSVKMLTRVGGPLGLERASGLAMYG